MLRDIVGDRIVNEIGEDFADNIEKLKVIGWKELRPWKEFFAVIKPPQMQLRHIEQRITTNFLHYRANYAVICVITFITQLILAPIVLLTLALCICFSTFLLFVYKKPIVINNDIIIDGQKKTAVAIIFSSAILILSGSLQRILWSVIISITICGLHMILRPRSVTSKANKLYDELKVSGFSWFGGQSLTEKAKEEDPDLLESQSSGVAGPSESMRKRTFNTDSSNS